MKQKETYAQKRLKTPNHWERNNHFTLPTKDYVTNYFGTVFTWIEAKQLIDHKHIQVVWYFHFVVVLFWIYPLQTSVYE